LGGDIPYGSRGHVLTRAERKEYLPLPGEGVAEKEYLNDIIRVDSKLDIDIEGIKNEKNEAEDNLPKTTPALRCQQVMRTLSPR